MGTMNKAVAALLSTVLLGLCPWYAAPAFAEEAVAVGNGAMEVVADGTASDVDTTEGARGEVIGGIGQVAECSSKPEPKSKAIALQPQATAPEAGAETDQETAPEPEPGPDLAGENIVAAMEEFGVAEDKVLVASTVDELLLKLREAKTAGTEETPVIVYVMPGEYTLADKICVERNVILVSEEGVTYKADHSGKYMVVLRGSIYGGTFYQGDTQIAIFGYQQTFTAKNGFVEHVTVYGNPKGNAGIMMYDGTTGATVSYCTVKGAMNGIKATKQSSVNSITNCTVLNCGYDKAGSGIDIVESNVGTIADNTVSGCKGHGISTGTNDSTGIPCVIGSITNNVIKNNNTIGVYIEGNCQVKTSFSGNTITGSGGAGVGIRSNIHNSDGTYSTTHYATYIKGVKNNKIRSNTGSNISVIGKKAAIYILSYNTVCNSKMSCGLAVGEGARGYISGTRNVFSGNKTAGTIVNGSAVLKVSGKLNRFDRNKAQGLSVNMAKVFVSGAKCTFNKNAKHGVSITTGGQVTITSKNLQIVSNGYNGVNVTYEGAYFKATSNGGRIYKNGNNGISMNDKSRAIVKRIRFSGNKKVAVYVGKNCKFACSRTNLSKKTWAKNRLCFA